MPYADPERQKAYQREWMAARRRNWLKAHGPCIDCGTWEDLQVDHVDARTKISHRVWSWSASRRETELAKCVVRCQQCHVRKTFVSYEASRSSEARAKIAASQSRRVVTPELREKQRQWALNYWQLVRAGEKSGPVPIEHGGGVMGKRNCKCEPCRAKRAEYRRQRGIRLGSRSGNSKEE